MRSIVGLGLAALLFCPAYAPACSCSLPTQVGFVGSHQRDTVRHLPANAKGVLFLTHSQLDVVGGWNGERPFWILGSAPAPLSKTAFVIQRQNAPRDEALKLTRLDVDSMLALARPRYFLFKDASLAQCGKKPELKTCKELDRLGNDWARQLLTQGRLTEITQEVEKSDGLFRVSPVGGFKPNERYSIRYTDASASYRRASYPLEITVNVDARSVVPNARIALEADGPPERRVMHEANDGSCSHGVSAAVQPLRYRLDDALEPYRDALLFFTRVRHEVPGGRGEFERWAPSTSVCSSPPYGNSMSGAGKDLVYYACDKREAWRGLPREVNGMAGLLEVDDRLQPTNTVPLSLDVAADRVCDTSQQLEIAINKGDLPALRQQVCEPHLKGQDPHKLLAMAMRLTRHDDDELRYCVVYLLPAIERMWGENPGKDVRRQVTAALSNALADRQRKVKNAALAMLTLRQDAIRSDPSLTRKVLAELSARLTDDSLRLSAANMLTRLGPAAKAATPALIAALKNTAMPNHEIPGALIAVAPDDPVVLQALIDALARNEYEMRDAAATALAVAGQNDKPRAVRALFKAAEAGNLTAMGALAAFGPDAKPAIPFLIKQARTSDFDPSRTTAMEVLAKIGDGSTEIVAAITHNLNSPTDYVRQTALESLSKIGPQAQSALPALAALLDRRNPSNYEELLLLDILRQLRSQGDAITPLVERLAKTAQDDHVKRNATAYWQELRSSKVPSP